MAGMRHLVLFDSNDWAYWPSSLLAFGCPSSQIAIEKLAVVPLWKVMAGPASANYNRTRKGPVFFFCFSFLMCVVVPEAEEAAVRNSSHGPFRTKKDSGLEPPASRE
jgi:hypothetical protein